MQRSESVNMLLSRLNNLNTLNPSQQQPNCNNLKKLQNHKNHTKSRFEDSSDSECEANEDGNHRLDLMRLPQYQSVESNNFKTVRPAGRELSQYSCS